MMTKQQQIQTKIGDYPHPTQRRPFHHPLGGGRNTIGSS